MLIDRQLGDGTIFARRAAAAEQKEEEELQDQMERGNDGADSFDTESAKEESDNNNGGKPRPARQETPGRGGAALRDEHSTTEILSGSYLPACACAHSSFRFSRKIIPRREVVPLSFVVPS